MTSQTNIFLMYYVRSRDIININPYNSKLLGNRQHFKLKRYNYSRLDNLKCCNPTPSLPLSPLAILLPFSFFLSSCHPLPLPFLYLLLLFSTSVLPLSPLAIYPLPLSFFLSPSCHPLPLSFFLSTSLLFSLPLLPSSTPPLPLSPLAILYLCPSFISSCYNYILYLSPFFSSPLAILYPSPFFLPPSPFSIAFFLPLSIYFPLLPFIPSSIMQVAVGMLLYANFSSCQVQRSMSRLEVVAPPPYIELHIVGMVMW